MNLYWGSAAAFVFFLTLGLLGAKFLHLEGPQWYLFVGLLSTLGLTASAFFYYFQKKWQERKEGSDGAASGQPASGGDGSGEPNQAIRDADARLAQSKAGAGMANLPMIFVLGDRSTAKTSSILNSGLEPELLAGQLYQDNAIVPTRAANIFFARGTVFVEAGGALMANPAVWARLVAKL